MTKSVLPVDQARLYFLLVMCNRDDRPIARPYVAEKCMMLWRCNTAWEVRSRLDMVGQHAFDEMVHNEGFAPVTV